jgi:Mor family transcriptional regulator
LEYNAQYQLDFTKPGYITKSIQINTAVPEDRRKFGFDSYKIGVRLFKQYDGVNITIYNQPVASIKYLPELDEIGYDTDYTKSILSLLTQTEEILEKKAKDEILEQKAKELEKKNAKPALKEETSLPAPPAIQKKSEVTEPQKPTPPASPLKEVDPLQQLVNNLPENSGEDPNPNIKPAAGSDPTVGIDAQTGTDKMQPGKGEDGNDYWKVERSVTTDTETRPIILITPDTISREVEKIVEKNRVITVMRIREGDQVKEYKSITYNWGGKYFFMDKNYSISEQLFNYLISSGVK